MNGEALYTSPTGDTAGRAVSAPGTWGRAPSALDLFGAVLLLRPPDPSDDLLTGLVARARADAQKAVAAGRASADELPEFRLLYQAARARASTLKPALLPVAGGTRWHRVFAALGILRHRQRAALALYYVAGQPLSAVGRAVGLREAEARAVVEAGVAAVVRHLQEPLDVRRSLRAAGARLIEPPTPETPAQEPVRMPRAVVRTLIGPTPKPIEDVPAPVLSPPKPKRRPRLVRDLVAAAVAIVVAVALLPASARDRATPKPVTKPIVLALETKRTAPARATPEVVPPVAVVRPGDSLWGIAAQRLGDGRRWTEIWDRNRYRLMAGGTRFTDPDLIHPAWRLVMPPSG